MRVRLKEHIDLYDLKKNHWYGCEIDTFNFLKENYSYRKEFDVTTNYGNVYEIDGHLVIAKCFDVIDNVLPVTELENVLSDSVKEIIGSLIELLKDK